MYTRADFRQYLELRCFEVKVAIDEAMPDDVETYRFTPGRTIDAPLTHLVALNAQRAAEKKIRPRPLAAPRAPEPGACDFATK